MVDRAGKAWAELRAEAIGPDRVIDNPTFEYRRQALEGGYLHSSMYLNSAALAADGFPFDAETLSMLETAGLGEATELSVFRDDAVAMIRQLGHDLAVAEDFLEQGDAGRAAFQEHYEKVERQFGDAFNGTLVHRLMKDLFVDQERSPEFVAGYIREAITGLDTAAGMLIRDAQAEFAKMDRVASTISGAAASAGALGDPAQADRVLADTLRGVEQGGGLNELSRAQKLHLRELITERLEEAGHTVGPELKAAMDGVLGAPGIFTPRDYQYRPEQNGPIDI